jgi:dihydrofolate reductase
MSTRVYLAMSLDGYIAGPGGDISWLPHEEVEETEALTFEQHMAEVGCMLMGRATYDFVAGFEGPWPYGEVPVLVASRRAFEPKVPTVARVEGGIAELLKQAQHLAGEGVVYLDGGNLVQQALAAGLVEELVLTQVPKALGEGIALFAPPLSAFEIVSHARYGSMLQMRLRPLP